MDYKVDWVNMLGLVDALSETIVKYYNENNVDDREVGLQAMVVLAHMTKTSIDKASFDVFMKKCVHISDEIAAARKAAKSTSAKN